MATTPWVPIAPWDPDVYGRCQLRALRSSGKFRGSPPPPYSTSSLGLEGFSYRRRNHPRKGRKNWNWEALITLKQQQSFPGLCVASSCLLSNLWPLQICFPALEVMWSPLRKARRLSFVFKARIYLGGNPKLPLHAFVGTESSAALLPVFSRG